MKLGVAGSIVPNQLDAVDDRAVAKIASLGFTGVATHFQGEPESIPRQALQRARSVFEQHGVRIVQAWSVPQVIISPDPAVRRLAVPRLQATVRNAAELGAEMAGVRPGSMNPRGAWAPHPDNHTPEVEDALVAALREAAVASRLRWKPTSPARWIARKGSSGSSSAPDRRGFGLAWTR